MFTACNEHDRLVWWGGVYLQVKVTRLTEKDAQTGSPVTSIVQNTEFPSNSSERSLFLLENIEATYRIPRLCFSAS